MGNISFGMMKSADKGKFEKQQYPTYHLLAFTLYSPVIVIFVLISTKTPDNFMLLKLYRTNYVTCIRSPNKNNLSFAYNLC